LETESSKLQVLIDLGLTPTQARVYLVLVESEPLKASAISKISKVARPDIYQTLSKLHQLGLVEKIIRKPLMYTAIPIDEGLSSLLEAKKERYEKVMAEAQLLLDTVKIAKTNKKKTIEEPLFVLVPQGRTIIEKIKTAMENAQQSIDLVLSWKRFSMGIFDLFSGSIETAWAKNVKVRLIIERPLESKTSWQLIQYCREKPSCQIKFFLEYPKTIFGIYDKKEVFIIVFPKTDLPGSPALWSNDPSLIAMAENHFETLWSTAAKNYHKIPRKPKK
jgi:sugar-specific transcriptional regulator TrmB